MIWLVIDNPPAALYPTFRVVVFLALDLHARCVYCVWCLVFGHAP